MTGICLAAEGTISPPNRRGSWSLERVDPGRGMMDVSQIGWHGCEEIPVYTPARKNGKPDMKALDMRRGGILIWKKM